MDIKEFKKMGYKGVKVRKAKKIIIPAEPYPVMREGPFNPWFRYQDRIIY